MIYVAQVKEVASRITDDANPSSGAVALQPAHPLSRLKPQARRGTLHGLRRIKP
jgi:hypothetical protein